MRSVMRTQLLASALLCGALGFQQALAEPATTLLKQQRREQPALPRDEPSTSYGIADYIFAGLNATPSRAAGYSDTVAPTPTGAPSLNNVVTVESQVYTVISTYWAPEHSSVVAVMNGESMALMADGHVVTLGGEQLAVQSQGVIVIGTGPVAATVTAPP